MEILHELGINNATDADCTIVAYVCSVISTRSAHLCAAGFSAVLMHMQKPYVTIGIDGSLYKFHRTFARILDEKINELLPSNIEYQLMLSEDGSGRGAALVAAVASRMAQDVGNH
ncbi:Putative hexokinase HKDC1 [Toxocara canis]|uniref:Phosphotransferase n=1 Tax=Toxocara canis TaxID=6265 RepID=A0A0B2UT71_TOXCA|nr:Putative hexokinase HKDC1 [Toxocara canis]